MHSAVGRLRLNDV